ncbi:MAG TPA: prolyl oligopeptidase family serine peptidase [Blastocatellia bacterium]|nr:prolyl oligopeptidase family serine peptidase [Blastocatellia bacterium]HMZ17942.1 prolyl oligopeptidase family serine peptidase [Blastocatellia bacterium]HNG30242.1 prolyl oligopeptidase family serine peptidase [Blastocatellia bacterium]
MRSRLFRLFAAFVFGLSISIAAQQNNPDGVKPVPPLGIEVPAADRTELEAGIAALGKEIDGLREALKKQSALLALLPDVQIFHNAARYALAYNEFFKPEEIATAKRQLKQGIERAAELRAGKASWTTQTGLVVRGYVSEIDGSVQPYGLVVPPTYQPGIQGGGPHQYRLDVWFHGRGDTLSEVNFLADRQKNAGQFTPSNTIVLHPYGRYNCANKFAGEVDLFEALASVKRQYPIDENRVSVRGFSMGGAATWHIAAHHAGLWAAAAPGAGFAETAEYQKLNLNSVPWYEQKLWHLTNATDYAANLFNCPVVAYSGEIDKQIQAAQVMARELKAEGIELTHIIGPQTEHKYHPDAIKEISRRIDGIVAAGRNPLPRRVKFTTWTLRYNRMSWVVVDALDQHWERARVEAELRDNAPVQITTQNVAAFSLEMPSGLCPLDNSRRPTVVIDKQEIAAAPVMSDRSWTSRFRKTNGKWKLVETPEEGLRKVHGLQGPIDDAFMSSFVFVRPTGKAMNEAVAAWTASELNHAVAQWRQMFRGEARVKDDTAVTDADIAAGNLILWGDPSSNTVLAKVIAKLPIAWDAQTVRVGEQSFPANQHAPVMIYPNPLNPKRYVVINSGFTFREAHYLTNSQQTPKLPDWAVIDLSVPPGPRVPGRVAAAGFFGERWEILKGN